MIFSRNIIEQIFLTNQKLERNTPQISKTKCIVNFRKYISLIKQVSSFSLEHWEIADLLAFKQNRKKTSDGNF